MSFTFWLAAIVVLLLWYLIYHLLAFHLKYSLKGKVILITGCDTGFGNDLAKKLDSMSAIVFAACLNPTKAYILNKETSVNVNVFIMDVTKLNDISASYKMVKDYCIQHKSYLFALVNNAGITHDAPFECVSRETYTKVIDVNCIGLINVTRAFLPLIRFKKYNPYIAGKYCKTKCGFYQRGKAGRIVNIASVAGRAPSPYMCAYNVSKYGVVAFTESLRYEMDAFFNIWCCSVEPFFVETHMTKHGRDLERTKQFFVDNQQQQQHHQHDVYDIAKYIEWKKGCNKVIDVVTSKNTDAVIDSILCALSGVYPLKVYYPSWRAMVYTRFIKYVFPGFLCEGYVTKQFFSVKPIKDSYLR